MRKNGKLENGERFLGQNKELFALMEFESNLLNHQIVAQHSARSHENPDSLNRSFQWEMFRERIPNFGNSPLKSNSPLELMSTTKDTTDYLWYTTR